MDSSPLRDQLIGTLSEQPDVQAAWLFGSQARGTARADSDVDVGVLFRAPRSRTLNGSTADIETDLCVALGREVQVIDLARAPADLVHRVLRDGVLLLDRDRSARLRFEVRARNEYFDLLPILQRYRASR